MVSNESKWILANTNLDPKLVADVWEIDEIECWRYIDELNIALNEEQKLYDRNEVQRNVREFVKEIPDRKNVRISVLMEQLQDAKAHPEKHDVKKLLYEVAILKGTVNRATQEMIDRAKQHPIENLLTEKPRRNVALCPLHQEKTPSFHIRNNLYTCFGCGESGDVISLYRKLHNVSFVEAVSQLQ